MKSNTGIYARTAHKSDMHDCIKRALPLAPQTARRNNDYNFDCSVYEPTSALNAFGISKYVHMGVYHVVSLQPFILRIGRRFHHCQDFVNIACILGHVVESVSSI